MLFYVYIFFFSGKRDRKWKKKEKDVLEAIETYSQASSKKDQYQKKRYQKFDNDTRVIVCHNYSQFLKHANINFPSFVFRFI